MDLIALDGLVLLVLSSFVFFRRKKNAPGDMETCSKLEVLNLEIQKNGGELKDAAFMESFSRR